MGGVYLSQDVSHKATDELYKKSGCNESERDVFISENLRLVHSLAHRYANRGIDYDDLFSAGCLGLVKAYDGFDKSRGFSFSTYAVPVILGEIRRLFRDGGAVKVSRSLKSTAMRLNNAREKLQARLSRAPTLKELADEVGISPEEAAVAMDASALPVSLTVEDDDGERIADIPDNSGADEDELLSKIALQAAVTKLDDNDKNLIVLRYFHDLTQSQTAKILNMTQVAVSRREKVILDRLKILLS